jgi:ribosomal protein L13E
MGLLEIDVAVSHLASVASVRMRGRVARSHRLGRGARHGEFQPGLRFDDARTTGLSAAQKRCLIEGRGR